MPEEVKEHHTPFFLFKPFQNDTPYQNIFFIEKAAKKLFGDCFLVQFECYRLYFAASLRQDKTALFCMKNSTCFLVLRDLPSIVR